MHEASVSPVGSRDGSLKLLLFCGGSGTRLWPMSRQGRPKQFQPLVGSDSLFQLMLRRLARGFGIENVFVSTGLQYVDLVRQQTPELPAENIIAEPEMRDTLAAVGYAVAVLDQRFPGTAVATLWGADHVIRNEEIFLEAIRAAAELTVERDWVVKIDVPPTYPNTGLGYIEVGDKIDRVHDFDVYAFVRQIEKPDEERAREFVDSGRFMWNTGYIVWTTSKVLDLYAKHAPDTFERLKRIRSLLEEDDRSSGKGLSDSDARLAEEFGKIEKLSIDYGVFQKMGGSEFAVMPADLGWSDIGAWNVLRDELQEGENVVRGSVMTIDTRGSLVYGLTDRTIVTIGLDGFIVVDTEDALLICPADRSQDVKRVIERLKGEAPEML